MFVIILYCYSINYNNVLLLFYGGLHSYTVVVCLVMRVCNFLILFCTDMFLLLNWHQGTLKFTVFIPTSASLHVYLRTQPTHSAPLFGYNADDPKRFLHSWHTQHSIFSLSQCTNLKVFLTIQANPPIYLYTPPTQSTHVSSYNTNDTQRFLKLYYYYPVYCIPLLWVTLI